MSDTEERLQAHWQGLVASSHGLNPTSTDSWWARVRDHYKEGARHYHTLRHIDNMFRLFEKYKGKLTAPETVGWAIFFHDVIYDPKARDNEEKSAELFQTFASECPPEGSSSMVGRVIELIHLTKTHITEAHQKPDGYGDGDEHYFLDFDMQVLGWPEADYDCYGEQIRQEYIHVPEQHYRMARAQILKEFLKTPNIYATKEFRDLYEQQARSNTEREIHNLERS